MPQTYVRTDIYDILVKSYPDRKPVDVINEAIEEKLRRERHVGDDPR